MKKKNKGTTKVEQKFAEVVNGYQFKSHISTQTEKRPCPKLREVATSYILYVSVFCYSFCFFFLSNLNLCFVLATFFYDAQAARAQYEARVRAIAKGFRTNLKRKCSINMGKDGLGVQWRRYYDGEGPFIVTGGE